MENHFLFSFSRSVIKHLLRAQPGSRLGPEAPSGSMQVWPWPMGHLHKCTSLTAVVSLSAPRNLDCVHPRGQGWLALLWGNVWVPTLEDHVCCSVQWTTGQIAFLHRSAHPCRPATDSKPGGQGFRPGCATPGWLVTLDTCLPPSGSQAPGLTQEGQQKPSSPNLPFSLNHPHDLCLYPPPTFNSLNVIWQLQIQCLVWAGKCSKCCRSIHSCNHLNTLMKRLLFRR